jgi:hypothetical protein
VLRTAIDQRPSGMRQKIAEVLGTHKSFVSQITNPADPTPIPARHVEPIIEVCHLSPPERKQFLEAYDAAHPAQAPTLRTGHRHFKTLHLQIPMLDDPDRQHAYELFITDTVRKLGRLIDRN